MLHHGSVGDELKGDKSWGLRALLTELSIEVMSLEEADGHRKRACD